MSTGRPICNNCKYDLTGLTESSKCPECGRPIIEVLVRSQPTRPMGRRYTSSVRVFGLPLVHVARGPSGDEQIGHARGIIAIGDTAVGFLALGGRAIGFIACGGLALGVWAVGGLSAGVVALGGLAVGLLSAMGGAAAGGVATGGGAVGVVATGGLAIGYYARGGRGIGQFVIDYTGTDPTAQQFFTHWEWYVGPTPQAGSLSLTWFSQPLALVSVFGLAAILALVVALGYVLAERRPTDPTD